MLTVAPLLGPLGRGLALFVADFEVSKCFHKYANTRHFVAPSDVDEWGNLVLVSVSDVVLVLDEQNHDLRDAMTRRIVCSFSFSSQQSY